MAIQQVKYIVLRDDQGFIIDMWDNKAKAAKALGVSKQTITNNLPSDTNRTVRHSLKIKGKLSEEFISIDIPTAEELFVNLPDEEWKPINNYPDYEISNYGRIRRDFKLKKMSATDGQYIHVSLAANGNVSYYYVHRLVAEHFLPEWNPELVVNHKDENKQNNHVSNLEMMTLAENFEYSRNLHKEE